MLDYDIDGMDDTKWHNFNVSEDVIVLNDVTVTRSSVDQEYGQTVTGGVGSGSESTSRFHGPSIDGSELGYPFDGWGSKGMEFFYNMANKIASLTENIVKIFNGDTKQHMESIQPNMQIDAHNSHLNAKENKDDYFYYRYRPILKDNSTDTVGVIHYKRIKNSNGTYSLDGKSHYDLTKEEMRSILKDK